MFGYLKRNKRSCALKKEKKMKKAVFVTGAAKGTGLTIAKTFAKEGYSVLITSREEDCKKAAQEIEKEYGVFARGFVLDLHDRERIKEVFCEIDALGVSVETVVLNAADLGFGTDPAKGQDFFTVPVSEFSAVFDVNLVGNFVVVREAALRMKENGGGSVVFIGSNTAYRAIPNRAAYCASKGGINAMAKALAVDLGPYGIRCNVVLPGTIKTDRWVSMGSKQIVNGELCPIGDISDYQDIANAAFFLGTPLSKNITGTEIIVDGGMSCQLYPQLLNTLKKERMEREKK